MLLRYLVEEEDIQPGRHFKEIPKDWKKGQGDNLLATYVIITLYEPSHEFGLVRLQSHRQGRQSYSLEYQGSKKQICEYMNCLDKEQFKPQ